MAGTGGGTEVIKKEASNHNYPVYTKRLVLPLLESLGVTITEEDRNGLVDFCSDCVKQNYTWYRVKLTPEEAKAANGSQTREERGLP